MTLEELFQRLSYGPLSNLAIGTNGAGAILDANKPQVVLYANDALLRLHTRFVLVERAIILKQVYGISNYELTPINTYSASVSATPPESGVPFIQDTEAAPFQDDLVKILRAYDAQDGHEIRLNDENSTASYFTPQNHVLQIPRPVADRITQVIYQARHPKLSFSPIDEDVVITLPSTLEEALVAYIGYLHYSSMNGQDNLTRSSEYLRRYSDICLETETRGVVNTNDSPSNSKFSQRGFA